MKKRLPFIAMLLAAMICGYLISSLTAANRTVATAQDAGTEETAVNEEIAAALRDIATNTESLQEIAERLEGIERELAWKRIEEEGGR